MSIVKSTRITHSLFVLILLLPYTISFADERRSRLDSDPELKAWALRDYAGVSVVLTPSKPVYIEGERIYINYEITCEKDRSCPWTSDEILRYTGIFHNGKGTRTITVVCEGHKVVIKEHGKHFTGRILIGPEYHSEDAWPPQSFPHLNPGHYTGLFDYGIMSPEFSFTVIAPPDSLASLFRAFRWLHTVQECRTYCNETQKSELFRGFTTRTIWDSLWNCGRSFLVRPVASIWRMDAIFTSISLMLNYRPEWAVEDSMRCVDLLTGAAAEMRDKPDLLLSLTQLALYPKLTGGDLEQALIEFAERNHLRNYLDRVRILASRPKPRSKSEP